MTKVEAWDCRLYKWDPDSGLSLVHSMEASWAMALDFLECTSAIVMEYSTGQSMVTTRALVLDCLQCTRVLL